VTCNPFIAAAYARVVFGWMRDTYAARRAGPGTDDRPVHLIELGAGSGRFAFLFLKRFLHTLASSVLKDLRVKYVMTDAAESNIACWRRHPQLRPFVEAGHLDFAHYDAMKSQELRLQVSGDVLTGETARGPVVVLANYVLDTLPQDAFAVLNGVLNEALLTVAASRPEPDLTDPGLINRVELGYDYRPVTGDYYEEASWNRVLSAYRDRLDNTVFLFPVGALRCLRNLEWLSGGRLLFLTADYGSSHELTLLGRREPQLVIHGTFSLPVNYHALGRVVAEEGGQVLLPPNPHQHLNIAAFLPRSDPENTVEVRQAFEEAIVENNPDDFCAVKRAVDKVAHSMGLEQLLSLLRLSGWDPDVVESAGPAFQAAASMAPDSLKPELFRAVRRVWEHYYDLGEKYDLARDLGDILRSMGSYADAIPFFEFSLRRHGPSALVCCGMARCRFKLGDQDAAERYLRQALELDPGCTEARTLRLQIEAGVAARHGVAPLPARSGNGSHGSVLCSEPAPATPDSMSAAPRHACAVPQE
jgi:hypothetical protein